MDRPLIALAGASGDLGSRIAHALVASGADACALVRPETPPVERAKLEAIGLRLAEANPSDTGAIAAACAGASCVVSALNGVAKS